MTRPTGTVTFLFSDIEGSSRRWERDRRAMADALERHDALVRAAIERHGGHVFKTIGDAFCAAFTTVPDAMAAALDAQRALGAEDFAAVDGMRVRMALHTGDAQERDGDYFGPPVNRVARLLSIGHGGQVLVSGASAALLQGEIVPPVGLRDLGEHRLKDLAQAERVYQLVAPDLPHEFPALRSLEAASNNLPLQLNSFIGREDDVSRIEALLLAHRLVTLTGTGGAGKTRCALQVGTDLIGRSDDGVWLAEFAPIAGTSLVPSAIAHVLSIRETADLPLLDTLLLYLKRKRMLLVLDNCEHVIEEARTVAGAILRGCPDVRIVATSRERLNIAGECVYRMPSLSHDNAVALFADRALASNTTFAMTDENARFVAEVCRRLDGIPLAIELAAARVKVLAPRELAQKLDQRFRVLTGGDRSALPRQQTMRALIDWSYDLLSAQERALFRRLSIFAGGFSLESASAVACDERSDEIEVLDGLSSLVEKSLVQAEPAANGTRYRLLESTRQYAREKLADCGEEVAAARAHASAYLSMAEELESSYESIPDGAWLEQAQPEVENWRAALQWTLVAREDVLVGQRLAASLRRVWSFLAAAEGRRWVRAAQDAADAGTPQPVAAKLDLAQAQLDASLSQYKSSSAAAHRALERLHDLHDPLRTAEARMRAGRSLVFLDRIAEGEQLLREALAAAQAVGARKLTGAALESLANARTLAGDIAEARTCYAQALTAARSSGAERLAADITSNLAEAEFRGGDALTALQMAGESLAIDRARNDMRSIAIDLNNIAAYLCALGRFDEARAHAREALGVARDVGADVQFTFALQHLAVAVVLRPHGDAARVRDECSCAAQVLGFVGARLAALDALREFTEQQEYDKALGALRDLLGEEGIAKRTDEGRAWSEDRAVAEALQL